MAKVKPIITPYINDLNETYAVLKGIYKAYMYDVLVIAVIGGISSAMEFLGPVFILLMEEFLENGDIPYWRGPILVAYLIIAKIIQTIFKN